MTVKCRNTHNRSTEHPESTEADSYQEAEAVSKTIDQEVISEVAGVEEEVHSVEEEAITDTTMKKQHQRREEKEDLSITMTMMVKEE